MVLKLKPNTLVSMAVVEVTVNKPHLCTTFSQTGLYLLPEDKTPLGFKKAQTCVVTRVKFAQ